MNVKKTKNEYRRIGLLNGFISAIFGKPLDYSATATTLLNWSYLDKTSPNSSCLGNFIGSEDLLGK